MNPEELKRLLDAIDAAKRLTYGLPVAAVRSDTHGNKMALWCDNGMAGVGQVCVAVNVGEFPDEQLTGIASLANCAIALQPHYLALVEENARLREALVNINRKASPDPERTMSQASNDLYWCACEARQALGEPK